ncbi:neprilysin-1 isoform X2 [Athalia rosae]|uniref:neprilysin-1 isoform X2 n=1 Tax=Athalia rosae TaxID=37344 RepID=UPI002033E850|nr:neprilysin-1 isoform X2 [Athalia rosae]
MLWYGDSSGRAAVSRWSVVSYTRSSVRSAVSNVHLNMDTENGPVSPYSIGSDKHLVPIKTRGTLFKTGKREFRRIIMALAVIVAILMIVVIVLAVLYSKPGPRYKVCGTEQCIRIAASLKQSMNLSANPCEDFYEYACGRWSREHPTPDSSSTHSWFSERMTRVSRTIRDLLRRNSTLDTPWAVMEAKNLYTSCVDVATLNDLGLLPLQRLLEHLDLPEIPAIFSGTTGNYMGQLARVKRTLGKDIFFGLDIFPDPKNKTRNIMMLGAPSTTSPLPSDKELDKRVHRARMQTLSLEEDTEDEDESDGLASVEQLYMMDVIREVISNGTAKMCNSNRTGSPNDTEISRVARQIYRMSGKIYFLVHGDTNDTAEEDIEDEDYMYIDDLQDITDEYVKNVNVSLKPRKIWRPFIEEVLSDLVDLDLSKKDKVLVEDLDYLKEVAVLMSAADDEILEATVWWTVLDVVVPHSSENLRRAWAMYLHSVTNIEVLESRSLHCANIVNELMGMAVAWLFVDPKFHSKIGPYVVEMLEDIREAFAALVMRADWMDRETKMSTLEKGKKMTSAIGYPRWLFEKGELDEYYEGINMSADAFLDNMLQMVEVRSLYELKSLHDVNPANQIFWATDPTDVNAFHTFQANQITVPVGILQFPFYELGLESLNYGAIGTVLGHELTHGFDNSGRQFDSTGNLRQWWSNETIDEYTEKTQCFVDHYGTYYEEKVDRYVDGELTLGENIADNGGLREAVWAYRRWKSRHGAEESLPGFDHLSSEQLLFLAFGHIWCESYSTSSLKWMLMDSHCPGHVRLTASLRNSHEFSEAWKCPVGSNMNPEKKCQIW